LEAEGAVYPSGRLESGIVRLQKCKRELEMFIPGDYSESTYIHLVDGRGDELPGCLRKRDRLECRTAKVQTRLQQQMLEVWRTDYGPRG